MRNQCTGAASHHPDTILQRRGEFKKLKVSIFPIDVTDDIPAYAERGQTTERVLVIGTSCRHEELRVVIPKRIIQTGPAELSLPLRAGIVNVTLLHPEFEYLFFDDSQVEAFVQDQCHEWRQAYYRYRQKIQQFDFFRYMVIYRRGGFYLDLDVLLAQSLTPLLISECVFPFEELTDSPFFWDRFRMDWQIGNYAFGAEPGHPFLGALIENCMRAQTDRCWVQPMMKRIPRILYDEFYVLNTSGPGLVSRTFAENPSLAKRVNITFPDDVLQPGTWHHFGTFGIHEMVGSWRKPNSVFSLPVKKLWEALRYRRMMARSRSREKTRWLGREGQAAVDGYEPAVAGSRQRTKS